MIIKIDSAAKNGSSWSGEFYEWLHHSQRCIVPLIFLSLRAKVHKDFGIGCIKFPKQVVIVFLDERYYGMAILLREYLGSTWNVKSGHLLCLEFETSDDAYFFWAYTNTRLYKTFVASLKARKLSRGAAEFAYINGLVPDFRKSQSKLVLTHICTVVEEIENLRSKRYPNDRDEVVDGLGLDRRLDPTVIAVKRAFEIHARHVVGFKWDSSINNWPIHIDERRWLSSSKFGYRVVELGQLVESSKVRLKNRVGKEFLQKKYKAVGIHKLSLSNIIEPDYLSVYLNCGIIDTAIENVKTLGCGGEVDAVSQLPIVLPTLESQRGIVAKIKANDLQKKQDAVVSSRLLKKLSAIMESTFLIKGRNL